MRKVLAARAAIACLLCAAGAGVARASGDSGTSSMADTNVTVGQIGMFVGALVVMGVVIWSVVKVVNK